MSHNPTPPILRWSTDDVPAPRRLDYFVEALAAAVIPMDVTRRGPANFRAHMTMAELGPLSVFRQSGSAHRNHRGRREISRSREHSFHLLLSLAGSIALSHQGCARLGPGDAVLTDSQLDHDFQISDYEVVHVKLPESWVLHWLTHPEALVGRALPFDQRWARPLAAFVAQLSPQACVKLPLPASCIADQIGALLALAAHEVSGGVDRPAQADNALRERIRDCILERCADASLTAIDVAAALNVPPETVHKALAASGDTFGAYLAAVRKQIAVRMLESPSFRHLSLVEIGRRAGLADAFQFRSSLQFQRKILGYVSKPQPHPRGG